METRGVSKDRRTSTLAFFLFCSLSWFGCTDDGVKPEDSGVPEIDWSGLTISQGIAGHVWFLAGDFMPGGGSHSITPIVRRIFVFENLPDSALVGGFMGFFTEIKASPLDSMESDSLGFFQKSLNPGTYRLFVWEDSLFYLNGTNRFTILPDSVLRFHIDIDYKAAM